MRQRFHRRPNTPGQPCAERPERAISRRTASLYERLFLAENGHWRLVTVGQRQRTILAFIVRPLIGCYLAVHRGRTLLALSDKTRWICCDWRGRHELDFPGPGATTAVTFELAVHTEPGNRPLLSNTEADRPECRPHAR